MHQKFQNISDFSLYRKVSKHILYPLLPPIGRNWQLIWRHDIQHNDTQHNDTQHNDTQHNDTQHNDTQHNDTQHNRLIFRHSV
jgi:hypothetical protein